MTEGKLLKRLRQLFCCRPVTSRTYRRRFGLKRKIERVFLGPDETVTKPRHDLLLIQGVAFDEQELEWLRPRVSSLETATRVVFGVPRQPCSLGPELEASEPNPEIVQQAARAEFHPARFDWYWGGQRLEFEPSETRDDYYCQMLEKVYSQTPEHLPRTSRARLRRASEEVLDRSASLYLVAPRWGEEPLRRLVEAGLLAQHEDFGGYGAFRMTAEPLTQTPDQRLLAELLVRLYGDSHQNPEPSTLRGLLDWLAAPPRGLPPEIARLYLCLGLACHSLDLHLEKVDHHHSIGLGLRSFQTAWSQPDRYRLHYRCAEPSEGAFLRGVLELFGEGREFPEALDLWQRVEVALFSWYEGLSRWARAARHRGDAEHLVAFAARLRPGGGGSIRQLLCRDLAMAFGYSRLAENEQELLTRLGSARLQLESFLEEERQRLTLRLGRLFLPDGSLQECQKWLDRGCREWLESLHPETLTETGLGSEGNALRRAITGLGPVSTRWFERLPISLGLPPLPSWERDESSHLMARLEIGRIELETWPFRQVFPFSTSTKQRKREIQGWLQTMASQLALPGHNPTAS